MQNLINIVTNEYNYIPFALALINTTIFMLSVKYVIPKIIPKIMNDKKMSAIRQYIWLNVLLILTSIYVFQIGGKVSAIILILYSVSLSAAYVSVGKVFERIGMLKKTGVEIKASY